MAYYTFDPMLDSRWINLASSHPNASPFHQQGWLNALAKTYGYRPIVLTSAPEGRPLADGIVFCEINSWITGSRLVSLPFADHTQPLTDDVRCSSELAEWMRAECRGKNWKYIELRPLSWNTQPSYPMATSQSFWFHSLSLEPSTEKIFRGLHKNCLQRRIRRADREHLSYETGCSEGILNDFYRLLMITRRRHKLLPQPRAWFRNLVACMSPNIQIRLARKERTPIAAILTLRHRSTVVYKYGCSDEKFHYLGGMPILFWKLIEESKASGAEQIDFGRTDLDNDGLIEFKDRFGAKRQRLTYYRYPEDTRRQSLVAMKLPMMRHLFSVMPDMLSSTAGRMLYRHIG